MSSIYEQAQQIADEQWKRMRWALGISGALAIAWAVVIIVWPSISLSTLVILFGAFSLARGVFGLAAALTSPIKEGRGWLIVSSLAGIVVGVVVFFYTDMSALALLYVIGAYAIGIGVLTIGAAFWSLLPDGDRLLLGLTGLLGILFGVVMFAEPGDGALVLLALIAAYSLIVGVSELAVAIGGKRLLEAAARDFLKPVEPAEQAKPQTSH
jgi:uncharacterized membrane protein HdeD (DUF308 family)